MYDYTDAYEQARQARESVPQPRVSPWPQNGQSWIQEPPAASQAPAGPMGDLQGQVAGVLNGADSHHVYLPGPDGSMLTYPRGRQPSILGDMIKGAIVGFGSALVWRGMQRRRATKGEFTSPGFRALGLLLVFPVIGLALSMLWVPESGYFLGWGCALGAIFFIAYAIYRATGHGNYNSRRRGSPWRDDHRRGSRRTY